ncbi:MAG: Nif11-like leader peptide family natural product precursor [Gloeomargarita sp. SKYBB_i_bin120]|nr:Nif11-like leader peptide family natural product precursor [Gloeomargarita sp. SKYG98]MCS7291633.1 Nif11-like leader peptide family natural product precursor [Gloeomargarita sp. SKYB120]MDW8177192.1 Nif11-like leader peptide family natural product precursor [Gloeomargarita sp. SKYBB_i_bin120]
MTPAELQAFLEQVMQDPARQERLQAANDPDALAQVIVELATEAGLQVTLAEVQAALTTAEAPLDRSRMTIAELLQECRTEQTMTLWTEEVDGRVTGLVFAAANPHPLLVRLFRLLVPR